MEKTLLAAALERAEKDRADAQLSLATYAAGLLRAQTLLEQAQRDRQAEARARAQAEHEARELRAQLAQEAQVRASMERQIERLQVQLGRASRSPSLQLGSLCWSQASQASLSSADQLVPGPRRASIHSN